MRLSKKHVVLVLVVGLCLLPTMVVAERPDIVAQARPTPTGIAPEMVIPEGPHYLSTWEGTTETHIELPANFFFEGSDAVDRRVSMEGDPIGPVPERRDGFKMTFARLVEPGDEVGDSGAPSEGAPYDTVMVQHQDAVLSRIGSQTTVDLTLQDVHLRSVAPVGMTGTETRYYDVFVQVTAQHQGDGRKANTGHMTYTRDGVATGEFTAGLFAWARYIFVPVDGGETLIYDHDEQLTLDTRIPTPFFIPALHQGRASLEKFCCDVCCETCHCGYY